MIKGGMKAAYVEKNTGEIFGIRGITGNSMRALISCVRRFQRNDPECELEVFAYADEKIKKYLESFI